MSDIDQTIAENIEKSLGEIPHPALPKGTNIYGSTKIFPDYKPRTAKATSPWSTASPMSRR